MRMYCCSSVFIVVALFLWSPVVDKTIVEMDPFSVEEFVKEPLLHVINSPKKLQLIKLEIYYKLRVDASMKGEVKRLHAKFLIDEEIIPEDEENSGVALLLNENELELRRLELQDNKKERETQLKLKELEVREKELSVKLRLTELETPVSHASVERPALETKFDIMIVLSHHFRRGRLINTFFILKKTATSLEWPRDACTLLL